MFCSIFHSNICVIWASSYFNWKCLHITGKSLSTLLCHGPHMTNGGEWRCSVLIISKCVIFGCSDSSCWPLDYWLRTKELFGPMHTNFESFTRYSLTPLPTYRKKIFLNIFLIIENQITILHKVAFLRMRFCKKINFRANSSRKLSSSANTINE